MPSAGAPLVRRAILFDLDGVLVDSGAVVARTWLRWSARHGLDATHIVERAHGRRAADTIREIAPHLDADREVAWLAEAELGDTEGMLVLPGAHDVLTSIPEAQRAVVTSGGRALATMRLRFAGLPVPRVMITADDVREGKPSPEGYRRAAELLGVSPHECVVLEDAPAGIAAARTAGAFVIGVATTFPRAALVAADRIIPSLAGVRVTVVRATPHDQLSIELTTGASR